MTQDPAQLRILVAAPQGSMAPLIEAFSGGFELHFLSSMAQALSYSYADTDAIVCCMYFDESRMFDLLRFAKLDPAARKIPFVCINSVEGALSKTLGQGITIACKALGAADFIDLCHWKARLGSAQAHSKLQQFIENLVEHRL